ECRPATTISNDLAKPVRAPTMPAPMGWARSDALIVSSLEPRAAHPGMPRRGRWTALGGLLGPAGRARHDRGCGVVDDGLAGDDDAPHLVARGHLEHDRAEHLLEDRAETPRARLTQHREVGDRLQRALLELELDAVDLEHALALLHQ